jgi:hypothetical protein
VLRSVAKHKQIASRCGDANARSGILAESLEEVEARLIALIEVIEERTFNTLDCDIPGVELGAADEIAGSRPARPSGERPSYFSGGPR